MSRYFPYKQIRVSQVRTLKACKDPNKRVFFIEAPTGSGKTLAALTGVLELRDYLNTHDTRTRNEQDIGYRILVFTRTHTQIEGYLQAITLISQQRALLPFSLLISKKPFCLYATNSELEKLINLPGFCKTMKCPLYTSSKNLPTQITHTITAKFLEAQRSQGFTKLLHIQEFTSQEYNVCAYYYMRRLMKQAPLIIATYPFLTGHYYSILTSEAELDITKTIIIVDEAHNLLSPQVKKIPKSDLLKFRSLLAQPLLSSLNNPQKKQELASIIEQDLIKYLEREQTPPPMLVELNEFLHMPEETKYLEEDNTIIALNPTLDEISANLTQARKLVLMSATLTPIPIFAQLLNIPHYNTAITTPIQENIAITALENNHLTSLYKYRNDKTYKTLAHIINRIKPLSPRGTLVVTPSYQFLKNLAPLVEWDFLEETDSTTTQIKEAFQENTKALALIVNGGKFTEGAEIVLPEGSALSTVIFTGIPFPAPGIIMQTQLEYYSRRIGKNKAKEMLYLINTVRLIRQAIGRTTRAPHEKGIGIILDFRTQSLMKYLRIYRFQQKHHLEHFITKFFSNHI